MDEEGSPGAADGDDNDDDAPAAEGLTDCSGGMK